MVTDRQRWPSVFQEVEVPIFKIMAHKRFKVVRPSTGPLNPRKYSWYSFLLEAE
jgi:hypothetical protein